LTVETLWLRRFYLLFFIEPARRRVHLAGLTANPHGAWVTQQARNLVMTLADEEQRPRFLIRDRDSKFTAGFDELFRSEGIRVIRAPIAAPRAKAHAERWVGNVRRECLDRIVIVSRRHRERVLREYVAHHNMHRPHRVLEQQPPVPKPAALAADDHECRVRRRERLGGLVYEYELAKHSATSDGAYFNPALRSCTCTCHSQELVPDAHSSLPSPGGSRRFSASEKRELSSWDPHPSTLFTHGLDRKADRLLNRKPQQQPGASRRSHQPPDGAEKTLAHAHTSARIDLRYPRLSQVEAESRGHGFRISLEIPHGRVYEPYAVEIIVDRTRGGRHSF
jgi:Integrase core domain